MPIFLLFTGITCNLGAYATWRKDFEKKHRASIVAGSIFMFLASVALAGLSLYPDHLCSDPFGGTFFMICIVCSQALSVLLVGIQMNFMISSACSSGSSKRTNSNASNLFKSYIPKFLTSVSGCPRWFRTMARKLQRCDGSGKRETSRCQTCFEIRTGEQLSHFSIHDDTGTDGRCARQKDSVENE